MNEWTNELLSDEVDACVDEYVIKVGEQVLGGRQKGLRNKSQFATFPAHFYGLSDELYSLTLGIEGLAGETGARFRGTRDLEATLPPPPLIIVTCREHFHPPTHSQVTWGQLTHTPTLTHI